MAPLYQARSGLEVTFRTADAYTQDHGIMDEEIDAATRKELNHARNDTRGRPEGH
jgi:hypothetical protein